MTMTEVVYEQALLIAPELSGQEQEMLRLLCHAAVVSLESKLRKNLTAKDCHNEFVAAASMYALAAMSEVTDMNQFEQITAGDLTLRKFSGAEAASSLRAQADMLMAPFVKMDVAFVGV